MPRTSRLLLFPVLAGLLGLGGCDSATFSRGEVAGTYVLASIGGDPLPVVAEDDAFFRVTVLSGALELRPGDALSEEIVVRRVLNRTSSQPESEEEVVSPFGYELEGDRIAISYMCPPNALCTPGPHVRGRVTGDEVRLDGPGGPWVYSRLGDPEPDGGRAAAGPGREAGPAGAPRGRLS